MRLYHYQLNLIQKTKQVRIIFAFALLLLVNTVSFSQDTATHILQIVFTSDAHYGIERQLFKGQENVPSYLVNAAMVAAINSLPNVVLPNDKGVNTGKKIGGIDYLIQTGDIANRQEIPYQSATTSWSQFVKNYIDGVTLTNNSKLKTGLLIVPGNHDVSNAIGFSKPMQPLADAASMVGIYNLMMHPSNPKTNGNYNYATDKINFSRDIQGIHFMFLNVWPDSANRIWMQQDLSVVSSQTPVIIFTHDQPECQGKHFTNPNGKHDINDKDKFENLLTEVFKEATSKSSTNIEQLGFVAFLKQHPNIKAYFHGNTNYNEFYTYKGPDNDVALPCFRVDSPIKGKYSADDETKLSFQFITIDTQLKILTVRECLWNTNPSNKATNIAWGSAKTINLK